MSQLDENPHINVAQRVFVSIVIPTFCREQMVTRTVQSALNQTYNDYEVVVFDDASTDGTAAAMEQFKNNPRFRYIRSPKNLNMPHSWGEGMRRATGEYVAFVSDDDQVLPTFLEAMVNVVRQQNDVAAVFSNFFHSRDGALAPAHATPRTVGLVPSNDLLHAALVVEWHITPTLYRRSELLEFWPKISGHAQTFDVALNVQFALAEKRVLYLSDKSYISTLHAGQVSQRTSDIFKQKVDLLQALLNTPLHGIKRKIVRTELSNWYVTRGAAARRQGNRREAIAYCARGLRANPSSLWAWRQLIKSTLL